MNKVRTLLKPFYHLKGQYNEIFNRQFFSSFEPAWATDQWSKIVSFLVSFSPRFRNLVYKIRTPRSMILRGLKKILILGPW